MNDANIPPDADLKMSLSKMTPGIATPQKTANDGARIEMPAAMSGAESIAATNPTESNLALAFVARHVGQLIYCAELSSWFAWVETHWQRETTELAYHYCVELARRMALASRAGKALAKASFAAGVERIARAERAFAITADHLDRDSLLIATPRGTIDLRTNTLRPAQQSDFITMITKVAPTSARPVRWLTFLEHLFAHLDHDEQVRVIAFLQEWFGYGLTGSTKAEKFLYIAGPGGNGKGTLEHMRAEIMGDYYHPAPLQLLLWTPMPQHSTSIASLAKKRVVCASELPAGARLDEQKLKAFTGGDLITARKVQQDDRTFAPAFKLDIASNHPPRLVRPDAAILRRLMVLNLPNVIANPDPDFKYRLANEEAGQVLAWALEGWARLRERGERFELPATVKADSERYLASQDAIGLWIDERCERDEYTDTERTKLFEDFERWAKASNEFPLSAREFYSEMERRRLRLKVIHGTRFIAGIKLKHPTI